VRRQRRAEPSRLLLAEIDGIGIASVYISNAEPIA
jgi:hypothetical protein